MLLGSGVEKQLEQGSVFLAQEALSYIKDRRWIVAGAYHSAMIKRIQLQQQKTKDESEIRLHGVMLMECLNALTVQDFEKSAESLAACLLVGLQKYGMNSTAIEPTIHAVGLFARRIGKGAGKAIVQGRYSEENADHHHPQQQQQQAFSVAQYFIPKFVSLLLNMIEQTKFVEVESSSIQALSTCMVQCPWSVAKLATKIGSLVSLRLGKTSGLVALSASQCLANIPMIIREPNAMANFQVALIALLHQVLEEIEDSFPSFSRKIRKTNGEGAGFTNNENIQGFFDKLSSWIRPSGDVVVAMMTNQEQKNKDESTEEQPLLILRTVLKNALSALEFTLVPIEKPQQSTTRTIPAGRILYLIERMVIIEDISISRAGLSLLSFCIEAGGCHLLRFRSSVSGILNTCWRLALRMSSNNSEALVLRTLIENVSRLFLCSVGASVGVLFVQDMIERSIINLSDIGGFYESAISSDMIVTNSQAEIVSGSKRKKRDHLQITNQNIPPEQEQQLYLLDDVKEFAISTAKSLTFALHLQGINLPSTLRSRVDFALLSWLQSMRIGGVFTNHQLESFKGKSLFASKTNGNFLHNSKQFLKELLSALLASVITPTLGATESECVPSAQIIFSQGILDTNPEVVNLSYSGLLMIENLVRPRLEDGGAPPIRISVRSTTTTTTTTATIPVILPNLTSNEEEREMEVENSTPKTEKKDEVKTTIPDKLSEQVLISILENQTGLESKKDNDSFDDDDDDSASLPSIVD